MKILFTNFHPGIGGGHVTYIVSLLLGMKATHNLFVACPATSRLFKRASAIADVQTGLSEADFEALSAFDEALSIFERSAGATPRSK